ncbi:hypothetical protein Fcan01_28517 [Folsomia candida]|uniref:Uncharacterized protein n=1 Tax=Folsomia candida TaxID=158441 RepID=A0A226CUY9_FOLCA|nr:hypothetical protein Fcan01_28517 [Folsomia candida]
MPGPCSPYLPDSDHEADWSESESESMSEPCSHYLPDSDGNTEQSESGSEYVPAPGSPQFGDRVSVRVIVIVVSLISSVFTLVWATAKSRNNPYNKDKNSGVGLLKFDRKAERSL